jgi:hypothetical protein
VKQKTQKPLHLQLNLIFKMKKILLFGTMLVFMAACGSPENATETEEVELTSEADVDEDGVSYPYAAGEEVDESKAIDVEAFSAMLADYNGDSIDLTLTANIIETCKKKGCWMTIDLPDDKELMVRFKDYEFFVPLNADGRTTTITGKFFIDTIPVAQLKHYAEDKGASEEEIAAITEPKVKYAFEANGVIVK